MTFSYERRYWRNKAPLIAKSSFAFNFAGNCGAKDLDAKQEKLCLNVSMEMVLGPKFSDKLTKEDGAIKNALLFFLMST